MASQNIMSAVLAQAVAVIVDVVEHKLAGKGLELAAEGAAEINKDFKILEGVKGWVKGTFSPSKKSSRRSERSRAGDNGGRRERSDRGDHRRRHDRHCEEPLYKRSARDRIEQSPERSLSNTPTPSESVSQARFDRWHEQMQPESQHHPRRYPALTTMPSWKGHSRRRSPRRDYGIPHPESRHAPAHAGRWQSGTHSSQPDSLGAAADWPRSDGHDGALPHPTAGPSSLRSRHRQPTGEHRQQHAEQHEYMSALPPIRPYTSPHATGPYVPYEHVYGPGSSAFDAGPRTPGPSISHTGSHVQGGDLSRGAPYAPHQFPSRVGSRVAGQSVFEPGPLAGAPSVHLTGSHAPRPLASQVGSTAASGPASNHGQAGGHARHSHHDNTSRAPAPGQGYSQIGSFAPPSKRRKR